MFYQSVLLCQLSLPYRDPGNERVWKRRVGRFRFEVHAGRLLNHNTGEIVDIGLPFGPKPRLILYCLHALARKTGSPRIELGESLTSFVTRTLGLDGGGRTIRAVKEQLNRLSAADFRFYHFRPAAGKTEGDTLMETLTTGLDIWVCSDERQRLLWPSTVEFSKPYFELLMRHPIRLYKVDISRLSHSALALDIYAWIAFWLNRESKKRNKTVLIKWASLKAQFGSGYERTDSFKRAFGKAFLQVQFVYPREHIVLDEQGLRVYQKGDYPDIRGTPLTSAFRRWRGGRWRPKGWRHLWKR
jgi:hypothetical protein